MFSLPQFQIFSKARKPMLYLPPLKKTEMRNVMNVEINYEKNDCSKFNIYNDCNCLERFH